MFLLSLFDPAADLSDDYVTFVEITFSDQATQKKKIQVQVESFVRILLKKALSLR